MRYIALAVVIVEMLSHLKFGVLLVATAIFSWLSARTVLLFQAVEGKSEWWQSPAFTASIAAGVFVVAARFIDNWLEARREAKKEREQDAEDLRDKQLTLSERLEELTGQQWLEVIQRRDVLHAQEIDFLRSQNFALDVSKFELRERTHLAMDEVTKLQAYAVHLEQELIKCDHTYTPYRIKSYFEIMEGIDEKVRAYEDRKRGQCK